MNLDEIAIAIVVTLVFGSLLLFLYFGGTLLILVSSWVPMKTRLRWAAFSVTPLALLVALAAIAAAFVGNNITASGTGERFGDAFAPVGLMAGLVVVGVIAANWIIFKRFRAAFPRVPKSPSS